MGCRKNLTALTLAERQAFVNAILQLKANGGYNRYVQMHQGALGHGHVGPAFFPWHREYLRRFELDLQAIDPSVNLHYWDWTVANLNPAGTESLIWRNDFMGGPGDAAAGFALNTGPFVGPAWNLRRSSFDIFQFPGGGGTMATLAASLNYSTFRQIEGPHGGAHSWVGGNVGNAAIAPQDPVFWLIHSNVDRLWAEWTVAKTGQAGWVQYAPTSGGPLGHNLGDTMWPWNGTTNPFGVLPWTTVPENARPADLLDHRAHNTFYDTIDPECRRIKIKDRLPKELIKDRLPKEFLKDRLTKELGKDRLPKERLTKENLKDFQPKEFAPKELGKDRDPKELKDMREGSKRFAREEIEPFIPEELRPDLLDASLGFEPDIGGLRDELRLRAEELGGGGPF